MKYSFSDEKITETEIHTRSVLKPNLVLLWSSNDSLYHKLNLRSPHEITNLSFCPYDGDILIGGMITGQLIIWNLQQYLSDIEDSQISFGDQNVNREKIYLSLQWSKTIENLQLNVIYPKLTTLCDYSHKKCITVIKWLSRNESVASTGLIQKSVKPNELYRQFLTASLDGTISFWDLDIIDPIEKKSSLRKSSILIRTEQNITLYHKLKGTLRSIYTVACDLPITDLMFRFLLTANIAF